MDNLRIIERDVSSLRPSPANARTHSKKQIGQIADSIRAFGFNNPVLIDDDSNIVAGHGRVEAAKLLGLSVVPTLELRHLSPAQKRAYVIADNRLAELAGWDRDILALEFQNLADLDLDFSITDIGFETVEIDLLLSDFAKGGKESAEVVHLPSAGPAITQPGDLWLVGEHRIVCGDARDAVSYQTLMQGEHANMVFADPPYNLPITGYVAGRGKTKHNEFQMASGEMSKSEFVEFLGEAFQQVVGASRDGSIHFICMDWRHIAELLHVGSDVYTELKNLCVWVKPKGGMGSLYRSQHELVAVFKQGTAPHINSIDLGRHGRYRTNVWEYGDALVDDAKPDGRSRVHPTIKPTAMVSDAIMDCSKRGQIILDPFAGAGTTIVAAQRTGRKCYAIEISPEFVDAALKRARTAIGAEPICARSGRTFASLEAEAVRRKSEGGRNV